MKKILLLVSLITALSSCGGGGGGGSAAQTSSATPIAPAPGNANTASGNINGDISNQNTGTGNINISSGNTSGTNNEQVVQPQNPAIAVTPQSPTANNNFPKPVDSRNITGKGVKVGVLDSDFLSGDNARTENFHTRPDYQGYPEGDTFTQVIEDEFGGRFSPINKTLGPKSILNGSDHGLMVATILAGKNGKGAKNASVYGVSLGERGDSLITDKEKYEELYSKGVRIFNQSFGTPSDFSKYNSTNYKFPLRTSVLIENLIDASI